MRAFVLAGASVALLGCGGSDRPAGPSGISSVTRPDATLPDGSLPARRITMMDACDPATFNAELGPGTCVNRNGGVTFENFIDQLTKNQKVGSWHNAPPMTTAQEGQTLLAVNRGGEVHTFTPVQEFGGGFIDILNDLSGNPDPAPECLEMGDLVFIPPGGTDEAVVGPDDIQQFQCCLHPWMRTTVHTH